MTGLFQLFRAEVAEDGNTLPNGRIEEASPDSWQSLLDLIQEKGWALELRSGSQTVEQPRRAVELFGDELRTLAVWPGAQVQLNFFPLTKSCIDFDFSARDLETREAFAAFCDAMRAIAVELSSRVLLSHEGADDLVFMEITSTGEMVWQGRS